MVSKRWQTEKEYRPMFALRLSDDHGKTWRLRSVCKSCKEEQQPPTRVKNEGVSGALTCDLCGALNELFL